MENQCPAKRWEESHGYSKLQGCLSGSEDGVGRLYMVGSAEGVFRLRTVYRVPTEEKWNENLSLVTGLPWKHNAEHEVGDEVVLDAYAPEPSSNPVGSPLPPRTLEESMKVVKRFYVNTRDLDPSGGGIGWAAG